MTKPVLTILRPEVGPPMPLSLVLPRVPAG
jgi:hypothetical protein